MWVGGVSQFEKLPQDVRIITYINIAVSDMKAGFWMREKSMPTNHQCR